MNNHVRFTVSKLEGDLPTLFKICRWARLQGIYIIYWPSTNPKQLEIGLENGVEWKEETEK